VITAGVAISAFWIFIVHSATAKNPLFDRSLMSNRTFLTSLLFAMLLGTMMFGIFALLPPMMQNLYGYTVFDTGVLLAPRGLGILFAMAIAGRLIQKLDPRYLVVAGFSVVVASLWLMSGWALVMDARPFVVVGFLQGMGMGLTFMPLNLIAFSSLPLAMRTDASSILYLARSLGGSFGISLMVTMLSRNIQTSHSDLAGHITSSTMGAAIDPATADRWGVVGDAALRVLDLEVNRQAAMIAYLSDFKLMMILVLCFMPLVLLLKAPGFGNQRLPMQLLD
jgi:DHA2 family multidrug resistance protein